MHEKYGDGSVYSNHFLVWFYVIQSKNYGIKVCNSCFLVCFQYFKFSAYYKLDGGGGGGGGGVIKCCHFITTKSL